MIHCIGPTIRCSTRLAHAICLTAHYMPLTTCCMADTTHYSIDIIRCMPRTTHYMRRTLSAIRSQQITNHMDIALLLPHGPTPHLLLNAPILRSRRTRPAPPNTNHPCSSNISRHTGHIHLLSARITNLLSGTSLSSYRPPIISARNL